MPSLEADRKSYGLVPLEVLLREPEEQRRMETSDVGQQARKATKSHWEFSDKV